MHVTEKEALDFLKLLKRSKYKIIEQLDKMPIQTSILDLFLTSEPHREVLFKILSEIQVLKSIPVEKFPPVIENILISNHITFSNNDSTPKGIGHNRPLYITVHCNGKFLPKILMDNGLVLKICS